MPRATTIYEFSQNWTETKHTNNFV